MPARSDYLNQDFAARNAWNFYAAVLIGLEIFFGLFVFASEESLAFGVADVDAGAADAFAGIGRDYGDVQPGLGRIVGFLVFLGFGIDGRLVRDVLSGLA